MSTDQNEMHTRPNIVLVHGAWAEGSSWSSVIGRLQADGYRVTAPQFPLTSLADDVARLRHVLRLQDRPTIIAGHSYGGQVMTALGTDAPNVVGLAYIAAFGIDEGESLGALLSQGPPTPALARWAFTTDAGRPPFLSKKKASRAPRTPKIAPEAPAPLTIGCHSKLATLPVTPATR